MFAKYRLVRNSSSTQSTPCENFNRHGKRHDASFSSYASTNAFPSDKLKETPQDCYQAGGEPSMILMGPVQARKIANWNQAGRITVNSDAAEQTLVMAV